MLPFSTSAGCQNHIELRGQLGNQGLQPLVLSHDGFEALQLVQGELLLYPADRDIRDCKNHGDFQFVVSHFHPVFPLPRGRQRFLPIPLTSIMPLCCKLFQHVCDI